jgi:PAS domain S-box-containing protein
VRSRESGRFEQFEETNSNERGTMSISPVAVFLEHSLALSVVKAVLVASVGVGVTGGILAWRERPEPGSVPLVFLLAGQCWWSAALLFRINATGLGSKTVWVDVSWLGTVLIPVAWLFFSLEYTGHQRYIRRRYILLASLLPAVTALLSLTNSYHHLLYVDSTLVERGGSTILVRSPGVWYYVIAGYTYLLGVLGAIPLLQFITSDVNSFRGQSAALLLGLVVPWLTNLLHLSGLLPTAGTDLTPAAFTVSGVAYLGAITRFQLFGKSPSPIRQARLTVFERMSQGAIVVDRNDYLVDANPEVEEVIGVDRDEIVGQRVQNVIPDIDWIVEDQTRVRQKVFRPEDGTGAYDINVTELTNVQGRLMGRIITLHDISEYVRQQQRLEVLNRVFRHNIRTNTQVIMGKADYLATHNSRSEANAVQQNAVEIERISEKIRTILDIFERGRESAQAVRLDKTLDECISKAERDYPEVAVTAPVDFQQVYVNSILEPVLSNTIENAAEHNTNPDPQVRIDVETNGDRAEVVVADNGPGIDWNELSLYERGRETPLEHGSGFGLAVIIWGTDIAGGEVEFEDNDPTGLIVTLDVPVYASTEPDRAVTSVRDPLAPRQGTED